MVSKLSVVAAAVAVGTLSLVSCGSDSGGAYVPPTGPPIKTFQISADNFSFAPSKISAPAGILQFDLKSADGLHDLVIEGIAGFQVEVTSGSARSGKVDLKAGKYTFYCDIAGHRAQGMVGTLTVK